jgi:hypothetical protein
MMMIDVRWVIRRESPPLMSVLSLGLLEVLVVPDVRPVLPSPAPPPRSGGRRVQGGATAVEVVALDDLDRSLSPDEREIVTRYLREAATILQHDPPTTPSAGS